MEKNEEETNDLTNYYGGLKNHGYCYRTSAGTDRCDAKYD